MDIQFREPFPDELAAFRSDSINDYARDLLNHEPLTKEAALAQAGREFDELLPGSFLKIIELASRPVGVVWYLTEETDGVRHAFLNDFVIYEEHRRKGCASAALTMLAQEARALGCTEIRLYVSNDNLPARSLYARLGYRLLRSAGAGDYLFKTLI